MAAARPGTTVQGVSGGRRLLSAALVVLGLGLPSGLAAAQAGPPPVCTDPCQRPDALIRRYAEMTADGDGIYNGNAIGQSRTALVTKGGTTRFVVRVENDGTEVDDLVLLGAKNTEYFTIRYFVGSQEVSVRVRHGIYRFVAVPPGAHRQLVVEVTARPRAPVRSRIFARVVVKSGTDPALFDRVKAVVYRSRGIETAIEGRSFTDMATARRWARNRSASTRFVYNAQLYWELAPPRGIRPEVAYAQSGKETGYGNFGGVIDASFNNPCGLKTTQGGGNEDPNAHMRFVNWRQGVTACIDHLALYAGAPGYPRAVTPDPRHFPSVYGTAPTVERLGGRWAPAPDYGTSIVRDLLNPLLAS
jgi:hypothetical protein